MNDKSSDSQIIDQLLRLVYSGRTVKFWERDGNVYASSTLSIKDPATVFYCRESLRTAVNAEYKMMQRERI